MCEVIIVQDADVRDTQTAASPVSSHVSLPPLSYCTNPCFLQICEDDIECHSYEEISTEPALRIEDTKDDEFVHAAIIEMAKFRQEFEAVVTDSSRENDLATFWLRKTKKPVLAVLVVQKPGENYKLYRGKVGVVVEE